MKILIVTPYFPPRRGGVENYTYNISKRLAEKGHEVTVLSTGNTAEETCDDFEVIRIKNKVSISNTPLNMSLAFKLSKILKKEDFDVVNAHMPVPFYADMTAITSKWNNIRFVLTYHNDVIKDGFLKILSAFYNKSLLQLTLRLSDKIITPSPYVYNESHIIKKFSDKTVLIPPGVDPNFYKPGRSHIKKKYNLPQNSKVILFIGTMNRGHAHKGVDILLRAFSKIKSNEVRLVLAGGGNRIPEYKRLARSLGIANKTIFTGFIDEKSLISLYRGSYMLVLPTLTAAEGFGMVLIEANACGKPVIGSKVGGIKYVIKDGKTGLLVPPGDPEALTKAIEKLLEDEELAKKMGSNGRKMVKENYTWDRVAKITEKVFEGVVYGSS
ncbi:MAG: glycosyltransferase family 4 protein [Thermoplasmata archaeon]